MEDWRRNEREQFVFTDLEGLVPQDHLLRKVEKVMDYEWNTGDGGTRGTVNAKINGPR